MTQQPDITENPFYQAVFDPASSIPKKAKAVSALFNGLADAPLSERKGEYTAFRDYLESARKQVATGIIEDIDDNPFEAKEKFLAGLTAQKLLDPAFNVLEELKKLVESFAAKDKKLEDLSAENVRLGNAFQTLAEAERMATGIFTKAESDTTQHVVTQIASQAGGLQMRKAPLAPQIKSLEKTIAETTDKIAKNRLDAANRAFRSYVDSGDVLKSGIDLDAPQPARFKAKNSVKSL